jgi:hypothetical protein
MTTLRHAVAVLALSASGLAAQGSISNQGFGYPMGGLSGASAAMSGASAELDANSQVNPAAVTRSNRMSLAVRFEPERKSATIGGERVGSSLVRFPSIQASGSIGNFVGTLGVSTMLDRTWRNSTSDSLLVGGEWVPSTLQVGSEGAMSDARFAVGYIVSPRLQVGAAFHAIVGENRTLFSRRFDDTSGVQNIGQQNSFGFGGRAVSVGMVSEPLKNLIVAASARFGQELVLELQGDELASANVPNRFGVGVTYFGIAGVSVNARVDRTNWTDLEGLGSDSVDVFDATEIALGVEALGPRIFGASSAFRAGVRDRTLPFGVQGNAVKERGFSFGIALPLARGRSQIDLGAQRMQRTTPGYKENAWLISLGLGIRP